MKLLIIFLLSCSIFSLYSQAPAIEWQRSYGTTFGDKAFDIIQNNHGEFVTIGYNSGISGDSECSNGGSDIWLVVTNDSGAILWQNCYGGSSSEIPSAIIQTADMGYAIAGYTYSTDGDVSSHYGFSFNADYWILKTDSLGNLEWEKNLGGNSNDFATSIQQTIDGGFIIAGYTLSATGDVTDHHGSADCWIVKLNSEGEIEWEEALGGSGEDYAHDVIQTAAGNYFFCGHTWSTNGDITAHHGAEDVWAVMLDASGNIIWQQCLGGAGYEEARSVVETAEGNFIMAGYTYGSDDGDVSGNHGDYDVWLTEIDHLGNLIWQKCLGGDQFELANSIMTCDEGGYLICGYTNSNNEDVAGCHDCNDDAGDEWVVKTDQTGNIIWQKPLGGTDDDEAMAAIETSDGYLIAGATYSIDFDVTVNNGDMDEWLVKLQCDVMHTYFADEDGDGFGALPSTQQACEMPAGYVPDSTDCDDTNPLIYPGAPEIPDGVDNDCNDTIDEGFSGIAPALNKYDCKMYPNPADDLLHLEFNDNAINGPGALIRISDLAGRILFEKDLVYSGHHQNLVLDLSEFSPGFYSVDLVMDRFVFTESLIVK